VKYSQMLTEAIIACSTIQSFAKKIKTTPCYWRSLSQDVIKINSIDYKWNEPLKRKMKWDSQNPLEKTFKSLDTPKWCGRLETLKWNEIEKRGADMRSLPLI
jgi:hypothetical protein